MQRGLSARESSGNVVNHCPEPENRSGFAANEGAGRAQQGLFLGQQASYLAAASCPIFSLRFVRRRP